MSVHDALPGDIYADGVGKLWRVVMTCAEPTVTVEEVEPPPAGLHNVAHVGMASLSHYPTKSRLTGSVSGQMWMGFKRIWRREA